MRQYVRTSGYLSIICAVLLASSWVGLGLFNLPAMVSGDMARFFQGPLNVALLVLIFISMLILIPVLFGLYASLPRRGAFETLALVLMLTAAVWFTSIQYYETFILPFLVDRSPALFEAILMMKDPLIALSFMVSGLPWLAGVVLFGIALMKSRLYNRVFVAVWILGGLLQLVGILPVRTVGLVGVSAALFHFGLVMLKRKGRDEE